ncbi:MAG TPA: hypothetical protein VIH78_15540 [Terriglobales bacterium]
MIEPSGDRAIGIICNVALEEFQPVCANPFGFYRIVSLLQVV